MCMSYYPSHVLSPTQQQTVSIIYISYYTHSALTMDQRGSVFMSSAVECTTRCRDGVRKQLNIHSVKTIPHWTRAARCKYIQVCSRYLLYYSFDCMIFLRESASSSDLELLILPNLSCRTGVVSASLLVAIPVLPLVLLSLESRRPMPISIILPELCL